MHMHACIYIHLNVCSYIHPPVGTCKLFDCFSKHTCTRACASLHMRVHKRINDVHNRPQG